MFAIFAQRESIDLVPCYILSLKKKSFFLTIAFMAVLNFKNKKLAFAIATAKPIEYLMPKMCPLSKIICWWWWCD